MRKGFTLIELVLVIAILGVLSIGVATMVINYKSSYIYTASQKVRSDIEYARSLATMKQGTVYGVFFNDSTDQYTVYRTNISNPFQDPLTKQDFLETFIKFPGVTITGGNYTVEFNKFGAPTTGGGGNVSITDGTVTKIIRVIAGTGKVTIQ